MSQISTESELMYESGATNPEKNVMLDYDEEPYSDDNILVRAARRRSFLISPSRF